MEKRFVRLIDRGVLRIAGAEAADFLQGLVSNDMRRVSPERTVFAALLSAQGKFQFDFLVSREGESLLLETEAERIPALARMLSLYKLRRPITIEPLLDYAVFAALGPVALAAFPEAKHEGDAFAPGEPMAIAYVDPRRASLGVRFLARHAGEGDAWLVGQGFALAHPEAYEHLRLSEGVPEGSRDAVIDRTILMENGYEHWNGIDFAKGCYVGQEVTARSKHRAELRKALCRVSADGELPPSSTPVTVEGREIGEMRSSSRDIGLALIRLDRWDRAEAEGLVAEAGGLALRIDRPSWLPAREAEAAR